MSPTPNYYAILSVSHDASFDQIKSAYRKESLKSHPDRLPPTATEAERKRATAKFQQLADAYFTLSDPVRRREYDLHTPFTSARSSSPPPTYRDDPFTSSSSTKQGPAPQPSASSFFSSFFGGSSTADPQASDSTGHANADETFTSVFADLLEPELGRGGGRMWSLVGGASGAAIGFIVGNTPGAMAGAFGGNRLGAVRDAKGKSVGEVFLTLSADKKAEILRALAAKVFSTLGQSS